MYIYIVLLLTFKPQPQTDLDLDLRGVWPISAIGALTYSSWTIYLYVLDAYLF
jgi:hypothetical protein